MDDEPKQHKRTPHFFAIAIIASALWIILSLGDISGMANLGGQSSLLELFIFGLYNLLFIIFSIGLLFLKKWGMIGLIMTGILYTILYLLFFDSNMLLFSLIPIGAFSFAALFIWRHYDLMQ